MDFLVGYFIGYSVRLVVDYYLSKNKESKDKEA